MISFCSEGWGCRNLDVHSGKFFVQTAEFSPSRSRSRDAEEMLFSVHANSPGGPPAAAEEREGTSAQSRSEDRPSVDEPNKVSKGQEADLVAVYQHDSKC
jgi:hypothetical protein